MKGKKTQKKKQGKRGKGLVEDLYSGATKLLTGESQKYRGEMHVPQLKMPSIRDPSIFKMANYEGPKTQLLKRLRAGDKPVDFADRVSKLHDIDYTLATQLPGNQQKKAIRKADNKMINELTSKLSIFHPIQSANNLIGAAGIAGKTLLEDVGLSTYKPKKENLSKSDLALLQKEKQGTTSQIMKDLGFKGKGRGRGMYSSTVKHISRHPNH